MQANAVSLRRGFTLVELLIVITILAVLGVFIILLINPAEILAKSRDSQRISDLATLKGAIQLYLTDGTVSTANCAPGTETLPLGGDPEAATAGRGYVKASLDTTPNAGDAANTRYDVITTSVEARKAASGSGWVPLSFTTVTSGSPLEALPVDPSADLSADADLTTGKYYRFACFVNSGRFEYEIDAGLESATWGPLASGSNNRGANDGGNMNTTGGSATALNNRYEVGNNLSIMKGPASSTP